MVKRPERGVDHQPTSSAEVKERVGLYLYFPLRAFVVSSAVNFICDFNIFTGTLPLGDRGSTVVKVLCYKSEGRWFDPSWCQWNFY